MQPPLLQVCAATPVAVHCSSLLSVVAAPPVATVCSYLLRVVAVACCEWLQ